MSLTPDQLDMIVSIVLMALPVLGLAWCLGEWASRR